MLIYRGVNPSRSITCGIELYPKNWIQQVKLIRGSQPPFWNHSPNITDGYFHSVLFPDSNRIAIISELPIQLITYLTSIHQTPSSFFHHKNPSKKTSAKNRIWLDLGWLSSWWFQPIWNILVKMDLFPKGGVKITKYLSCHHLVTFFFPAIIGCSNFPTNQLKLMEFWSPFLNGL